MAPLLLQLKKHPEAFATTVCVTAQHREMLDRTLEIFDIVPDIDLDLMEPNQTLHSLTSRVMIEVSRVLEHVKPDLMLVQGDTTTVMTASLAAFYRRVPVGHVEAGLRSFNWRMPEEINRVLTDRLSQFLFTTCENANNNLIREGISSEKIYFVGNVMIDTLLKSKKIPRDKDILQVLNLKSKDYAVLTMHRPSNVDSKENLLSIFDSLNEIQKLVRIVYPVHPRTRKRIYFRSFKLSTSNPFNTLNSASSLFARSGFCGTYYELIFQIHKQ